MVQVDLLIWEYADSLQYGWGEELVLLGEDDYDLLAKETCIPRVRGASPDRIGNLC